MADRSTEDIIGALYDMVQDARSMPLAADKCILERDRVLDMLDEILAQLPGEIKQSRAIVESRTEIVGQARREADNIVKEAQEKAKQMEQKLKKAEFDFNDFLDYMSQIKNMGGVGSILNMLPGMGLSGQMKGLDASMTEDAEANLKKTESIIYSMTAKERSNPDILNPSRKNRIAKGAGVDISEVNKLVKQFDQMKKMMKQMPGMMKGAKKGRFKLPF